MKIAYWNPLKTIKKDGGREKGLRKNITDRVNLIKLHYINVCKYHNKTAWITYAKN
jgi:hypothetical protein